MTLATSAVAVMSPRQEAQSALIYEFSIEDHVPNDHVLRAIDGVIDLSGVREHLTEHYSSTGRPSIDPSEAQRAVREYLETLDDAVFGAASPVVPKYILHSDPASQWTGARGGPAYFAYSTNYLINTDNAVIMDVEATRSIRQAEAGAVKTMIDRVQTKMKQYVIAPANQIVTPVHLKSGAAKKSHSVKLPDRSMKSRAISRASCRKPSNMQSRANCAKRSRCHLPISNVSTA